MDRVWNEYDLDNKKSFSKQNISSLYSHPVWIMNGLFTEIDSTNICHRNPVAAHIRDRKFLNIVDYGGGSGVLAHQIVISKKNVSIEIFEPFVSEYGLSNYDCAIAQDVLEHVKSPIEIAIEITNHIKVGGYFIFANCFYSVIGCNLPSTF